eukprot:scaffold9674_cov66-Phaeocystis_antarctica.AAC.2
MYGRSAAAAARSLQWPACDHHQGDRLYLSKTPRQNFGLRCPLRDDWVDRGNNNRNGRAALSVL